MSTPGCAILLDQDFTVILSGNQNVVKAIGESSFNLSHSGRMWNPKFTWWYRLRAYSLETLCEAACLTFLELFFFFTFQPVNSRMASIAGGCHIHCGIATTNVPRKSDQLTPEGVVRIHRTSLPAFPPYSTFPDI